MKEYVLIGAGMSLMMMGVGMIRDDAIIGLIGLFTVIGWFLLSYLKKPRTRTLNKE